MYKYEQLSRSSDWLGIDRYSDGFVALAADGSLWIWGARDEEWQVASRKPVKLASIPE
jgi:hypothetical protein